LLLLPCVGFLPVSDPRIRGTINEVERCLLVDGFVRRYDSASSFLACNFWLADAFALQGRQRDAERLFNRLLALRNDVGLLSEEFEPTKQRLVGNFPQAFSHVALINSAFNLTQAPMPIETPTPRRSYHTGLNSRGRSLARSKAAPQIGTDPVFLPFPLGMSCSPQTTARSIYTVVEVPN
jgi:hypothetical protein